MFRPELNKTFRYYNKRKKIVGVGILLIIITLTWTICRFYGKVDLDEQNQVLERAGRERLGAAGSVNSMRSLPKAIIIGCRKSGTRALLKFLEVNPQVRAAHKEVHYFDRQQNFRLGLDWYREQMPDTTVGQMAIEKSPAYFVTKHVPERIYQMNSSIKLIVIFRDPVTRLISDFSQLVANKLEPRDVELDGESGQHDDDYYREEEMKLALSDQKLSNKSDDIHSKVREHDSIWLEAEKEFEKYILRPDGGIDDQRRAIQVGMYSNYLEKWLSTFKKEQIYFVDGEKLILDPSHQLQELETFLGLKPFIKREHFVFDFKKGFFCLNSTTTSSSESVYARQEIYCLSRSKGRRHVKVRKELVTRLKSFYEPFNEYLFTLTGINFNDQSIN